MIRSLLTSLFLSLIFFQNAFAQNETAHWFFGVHAGLDFSSGSPVAEDGGQIVTNEGTASISDPAGNLLFYTDGITVWNRNHEVMPNGTGLHGGISSTQSALIVPDPASSKKYYLFTTDEIGGPYGFQFSMIDMDLDNGFGDVTIKDSLIQENVTEKLAAVRSAHKGDFWIAVHDWGSDTFDVYNLSVNGLDLNPVISNIGVVYTEAQIQNTYGQLKFSSCGNKLAAAAGYLDTLDIFDFDILTGQVSNRIALPMPGHIYGVEFSPSEQFVYVTTYYYGYGIIQYDLNAGSVADVIASQTVINSTPDLYALQLGLDGKIYVCKAWGTYLDAVDKPNLPQYDCDYISNAVSLDPNYEGTSAALGLPNFVSSFLGLSACIATNTDEELNIESAGLFPNPSTDQFTLRNLKANSSIEIYDVSGRLVEKFSSSSKSEISFGENFVAGCYMVIVKNEESNSSFKAMKIGKN